MRNLLTETESALLDAGKTPEDIVFIGSEDGKLGCTWEEFQVLADFTYHSGFGGQEVPSDLQIVFKDGSSLVRGEYDGSEWWAHLRVPKPPPDLPDLDEYPRRGERVVHSSRNPRKSREGVNND